MVRGELYLASDPELVAARVRARRLFARFNASDPGDAPGRLAILHELLGNVGAEWGRRIFAARRKTRTAPTMPAVAIKDLNFTW